MAPAGRAPGPPAPAPAPGPAAGAAKGAGGAGTGPAGSGSGAGAGAGGSGGSATAGARNDAKAVTRVNAVTPSSQRGAPQLVMPRSTGRRALPSSAYATSGPPL